MQTINQIILRNAQLGLCANLWRNTALGFNLQSYRHYSADTGAAIDPKLIRNFAIIAHVDHGKTTMMDKILSQCGKELTEERMMDSNVFEKERGITITSKYISLRYNGYTVNAVDTPGHADFGGEVERVMAMVDGCVLLVDPTEGPLAQTKYVLTKALQKGITPLVVLNKVDRETATKDRLEWCENALFNMFDQLGATEEQLDFPMLYASAKQGWVQSTMPEDPSDPPKGGSVVPLLDKIIEHVPPPQGLSEGPFKMLVSISEKDQYLGRFHTGKVLSGTVSKGDHIKALRHPKGEYKPSDVTRLFQKIGNNVWQDVDKAGAGNIVSILTSAKADIADTLGSVQNTERVSPGHIDPPTLSVVVGPNTSPFRGKEGTKCLTSHIWEYLNAECESSVSMHLNNMDGKGEAYELTTRGELQLGILIEGMRRAGYELQVGAPRILYKVEDGKRFEPCERVEIECEKNAVTAVCVALQDRNGVMLDQKQIGGGREVLTFEVISRGLIGFRPVFLSATAGSGIMNRQFIKYVPFDASFVRQRNGAIISTDTGTASNYSLQRNEKHGTFFIPDATPIYKGQIIGETKTPHDLNLNVTKLPANVQVRGGSNDGKSSPSLAPYKVMDFESCVGFMKPDELIEVTPKNVRLRKIGLSDKQRRVLQKENPGLS